MTLRPLLVPLAIALLDVAAPVAAQARSPANRPAAAASAPVDDPSGQRCADLWRAYERSAACYARYRTVHGVKTEAFERCGPPLKEPVLECPRR